MNMSDMAKALHIEHPTISLSVCKTMISNTFNILEADIKAGNSTTITGFGTFKPADRAARTGRNPQTGKSVQILASKTATFKVSKTFKDYLNTGA